MEREIEIKFKIDSLPEKMKEIEFKAHQEEDEYFYSQYMIDNHIYLRFRNKNGKIILNLKNIVVHDEQTKNCYEADEEFIELTEEQLEKMRTVFNIIFPIKHKVTKTRATGNFNDCIICHDKVEGLGEFIEIEGPKEKILETCKIFNLNTEDRDKEKGYARMTLKKMGVI
jgi:predicted adenylyl cyclase CyaB